jgi:hypothetical protein
MLLLLLLLLLRLRALDVAQQQGHARRRLLLLLRRRRHGGSTHSAPDSLAPGGGCLWRIVVMARSAAKQAAHRPCETVDEGCWHVGAGRRQLCTAARGVWRRSLARAPLPALLCC